MLVLLERDSFSQTLLDGWNTWFITWIHYELLIPSLISFLWTQVLAFADINIKLLLCLSYLLLPLKSPLSWTVNYMRVSANAVDRSIWVDTPSELVAPTCQTDAYHSDYFRVSGKHLLGAFYAWLHTITSSFGVMSLGTVYLIFSCDIVFVILSCYWKSRVPQMTCLLKHITFGSGL